VLRFQARQRLVDLEHPLQRRTVDAVGRLEAAEADALALAAALLGAAAPRVVDEDLAHRASGGAEEVAARVEARIGAEQPHEDLVHERGRLQRVAGTLLRQARTRQPVQFGVHLLVQALERRRVAALDRRDQPRHLGVGLHLFGSTPDASEAQRIGPATLVQRRLEAAPRLVVLHVDERWAVDDRGREHGEERHGLGEHVVRPVHFVHRDVRELARPEHAALAADPLLDTARDDVQELLHVRMPVERVCFARGHRHAHELQQPRLGQSGARQPVVPAPRHLLDLRLLRRHEAQALGAIEPRHFRLRFAPGLRESRSALNSSICFLIATSVGKRSVELAP
jgi:hypothetical protein